MLNQRRTGGRMSNYYPRPVAYQVTGGVVDDHEWGARLVGILYVIMGGVLLATPAIKTLGVGTQILFGVFGAPAFMTARLTFLETATMAAILIVVGAGVVAGYGIAFVPAMAVAFLLFMPSFPVGSVIGCLLLYLLWQGMPSRKPDARPETL